MVAVGDRLKKFITDNHNAPMHPSGTWLAFYPGYENVLDFAGDNKLVVSVSPDGKWVAFKAFPIFFAPVSACEFEPPIVNNVVTYVVNQPNQVVVGNKAIQVGNAVATRSVRIGDKLKRIIGDSLYSPACPTNLGNKLSYSVGSETAPQFTNNDGNVVIDTGAARLWVQFKGWKGWWVYTGDCEFEPVVSGAPSLSPSGATAGNPTLITPLTVKVGDRIKALITDNMGLSKHPNYLNTVFYPSDIALFKASHGKDAWEITKVLREHGRTWLMVKTFSGYVIQAEICEFESPVTSVGCLTSVGPAESAAPVVSRSYCNACGGYGKHRLMCPVEKAMR